MMSFLKNQLSRLLALVLVVTIGLTACDSGTGLTGNYSQDTLTVIATLREAIDLPQDAPNRQEVQDTARGQINDYISRYRRKGDAGGLKSFTTMQTALNSLAGYYTSYGARPIPEKLKKRLQLEFTQAERSIERGV
ncbi:photosystem II protein Psb27 [Synechocystis sp. PCC 7338]|uniref:photosystem II protein Psb27 n=2 Tax=unclassified Synechocystis TaxID=2640012 RepID=UPI001BB0D251|nr:photosystem II protein Psb27 [Synechocystis sp. PCC 7338]